MNEQESHIDLLIARYLAGEAMPEEAMALDEWRSESPENERYFAEAYTIYHGADKTPLKFDPETAWEKIQNTLTPDAENSGETSPFVVPKVVQLQRNPPAVWKIAAGIALLATLGVALAYFLNPGAVTEEFASGQTITTDTLFSTSLVTMNTNSSLNYRYDKRKNTETIELTGEAFFDLKAPVGVITNIEAGGLIIRDIGTAFHVSAYPQSDTVHVWVESGEVAIFTAEHPGISLGPGEGGLYLKSTGLIRAHTPSLAPNWHQPSKVFHFNKARLREIAEDFNAKFEQKLEVPDHLQNCRITVSFIDESPLSMATIIAETLGLTLEQKGDTLYLSGNGCPQ